MDFHLRPVEPGVSSPGVAVDGVSDAPEALPMGLSNPIADAPRAAGVKHPECRGADVANLSESTTSVARTNICLFPTKPSISIYMALLNSKDIFWSSTNVFSPPYSCPTSWPSPFPLCSPLVSCNP